MTLLEDLKAAVANDRATRTVVPRGRALYELNLWKGEQRKALDLEYDRRRAEIEDRPADDVSVITSAQVLALVAQAHAEGFSRSSIRVALGKQTLAETDAVIAAATQTWLGRVESGEVAPFTLRATGKTHAKGWPMYAVTLSATGEAYEAVYLVTPTGADVARVHMRLMPSPPGSAEILDQLWEAGVGAEMFARGKES